MFKTSDIRLHKDSQGFYEASHKYAGRLFDYEYFDTRQNARRAAVDELKHAKENDGKTRYSEY